MSENRTNLANGRLSDLAEAIWQHIIDQDVYLCLAEGLPIKNLPDLSVVQAERNTAFAQGMMVELGQLPLEELTYANQLVCRVLQWDMARRADELALYWYQFPVTPYSAPFWIVDQVFAGFAFETVDDLYRYRDLLAGYQTMLAAMLTKLEGQIERGILIPQEELDLVMPFLGGLLRPPSESPLAVAEKRLVHLPPRHSIPFRHEVEGIIEKNINHGFQALLDCLGAEYRAKAPVNVGLSQYEGGLDAYGKLIELHTTLPLSPQQIHEMGHVAVEELDLKMAGIRHQIGFKGSKAEFHQFLKTDSRFFVETPEEVGELLMAFVRRIEPLIPSVFSKLPEAPYGVKRLDPELEGAMTFGYYEMPTPKEPVGNYRYNGSELDHRSYYNAGGLIYHELVPGHHFHIARQRENKALPDVRRLTTHSAYTEGWAEYSANLAGELGMYDDLYDQYGRLAMEMFLAVRLVVDTGMNALGWSRDEAVTFMREHCLESETQLHTESLRYSVDLPAQALAYMVGSIQMHELRQKVEATLGNQFDLPTYHEAVLEHGSMPLEILESHLDKVFQP